MLKTSSFQVLINGEPGQIFRSSNGLRQGDPIAPYLFAIGMERLSAMLNINSDCSCITAPKTSSGVTVTHPLCR